MSEKIFDRIKLFELMGNDAEIVNEAISLFWQVTPKLLIELENAINENNINNLKMTAHKLKGSALNICAGTVCQILIDIENANMPINADNIKELFTKLNNEIVNLKTELKKENLL